VHVHLTALEAGWLTAALHSDHIHDADCNVPDVNGKPVPSTLRNALIEKLMKAWANHD
jgi:hypothetical protein